MAAKKRKVTSNAKAPQPVRTRFDANETFDGSEDEFETGRDQILLDEAPDAKRRRKIQEDEEAFQESDEEVSRYKYESDEDDLDDEEDGEEDYNDEDYQDIPRKPSVTKGQIPSDDEEEGRRPEEEEYTGWGSSKKDYYDADVIETEADALEEEEEAKKLQKKHLESIKEDDWGVDEWDWATAGKVEASKAEGDKEHVTEVTVDLEVKDDMQPKERLKILHQRYPEFDALSKEFLELQPTHQHLSSVASKCKQDDPLEYAPLPVVQYRALTAYLGTISTYFFLLTSPSRGGERKMALPPAELREHPIMEAIVSTKKQWEDVRDLEVPDLESDGGSEVDEEDISGVSDAVVEEPKPIDAKPEKKEKKNVTKVERAMEQARAEAERQRQEKLRQVDTELAGLSSQLEQQKATKKVFKKTKQDDSDFGDEADLDEHELAEKAAKKKSLRFYTSQIAQKANKRGTAGRDAGGDTDIPYRERLKDRSARLIEQAEKRGREAPDVLGGESDEEDKRMAREMRNDASGNAGGDGGSDSDDYYDMVASRAKGKKDEKKKRAEAYAEALKHGKNVEMEEEIGPDGKRAITYAIQKNKGLTPKRSKDVRNPRVKKRKKFAEKQKKLGSIRQVYKGGETRGGYGGEATGIKTNVVKSVKL